MASDDGDAPGDWPLNQEEDRRRPVDGRAIVERAHSLVHEQGASALTMRSLATSLGTSTSALYRKVPSKEWLLLAVVDAVLVEVDTSQIDWNGESDRSALERLSSSLHDVLSSHPHLHEVLVTRVVVTPHTVRIADAALSSLRGLGISDLDLLDAYNAWFSFVVGYAVLEIKPPELAPDRALQDVMRAQVRRATSGSPVLRELTPHLVNRAHGLAWSPKRRGDSTRGFKWGLRALLDGLPRRLQ